jgi:hypothetical protein
MNDVRDLELPVVRASDLADGDPEPAWLFEGLWAEAGVGLIGGEPKSFKSWLALEMATSLASGRPCLGVYDVERPGRVLLYMAEDAAAVVKQRLAAICRHRQLDLAALPIYVVTADALRLDQEGDQQRLRRTVERLRPCMLLLDPLVRLHAVNENSAGEISTLLAYFRQLQRAFQCAVVIVHHSRKNGSATRPGQTLRGSGDLHAFGDSNLYVRRNRDRLTLTFEHRAAPAPDPVELRLASDDDPHLEVIGPAESAHCDDPLDERVLQVLAREPGPVTRRTLRTSLAVRNTRLGEALNRLQTRGRVTRRTEGFALRTAQGGADLFRS